MVAHRPHSICSQVLRMVFVFVMGYENNKSKGYVTETLCDCKG